MRSRTFRFRIATLLIWSGFAVVLLGSLVANVYLYRQAHAFYLQLNGTRLDPFGLATYPFSANELGADPMIVFFGDSRAQEWPAPKGLSGFNFINRGIGAQTTAQVLGRFDQHVAQMRPDLVILQAGINDLKTIPLFPDRRVEIIEQCKANLAAIIERCREIGTHVVVTTIFPPGRPPLHRRPFWSDAIADAVGDVNEYLKDIALEHDEVTFLDAAMLLVDHEGTLLQEYARDLLHLTPAAYEMLNAQLVPLLQP